MDVGLLIPEGWNDYELVDCGGFEKLERFGRTAGRMGQIAR